MLEKNTCAPDFTLLNQEGESVTLLQFRGQKVVLYFYPKDNTPGCNAQASSFRDHFNEFRQLNTVVIGISKDSVASHKKFCNKFSLPFILLADPDRVAITSYDVWKEKKMFGKSYFGILRSTYIIDENGMIEHVMAKVSPSKNALEILNYLKTAPK